MFNEAEILTICYFLSILSGTEVCQEFYTKMTLWLIEPTWKQQRVFNNTLTSSVSRIADANEKLVKGG